MNELPVFISYRQSDGSELALWLHKSLYGQSRLLRKESLYLPFVVSPYLDRASPAVGNWKDLHERELKRSKALIVVCTPATMQELAEREDWFYFELRWWMKHNLPIAPILVTFSTYGVQYIPRLILSQWPDAQVTRVDSRVLEREGNFPNDPTVELVAEASIRSILGGISSSAGDTHIGLEPEPFQRPGRFSIPGVFAWEKDLNFRYINVNENYAQAAGFDSPKAMIGKTDEEMPWRSLVDLFRAGDQEVMSASESSRDCVVEKEVMADRVADILVNESPLLDRRGEIVGLSGCFLDITGVELRARSGKPIGEEGISLGEEFGHERLSWTEIEVFRGLVRSLSAERIADRLNITRDEVKAHVAQLRRKFQGNTEGDVIATAVRAGLPLSLFGPTIGEG